MGDGGLMGTGSFGGGSGSLGGGSGSLASGSRGGGGGASGSLLRTIQSLLRMTELAHRNPGQGQMTRFVIDALRDRARAGYVKTLMADGFTNGVFRDLFVLGRLLRDNKGWDTVEAEFRVAGGPGCLFQLGDAIIDRNLLARDYDVDERHIDRVSSALSQFMLTLVGGDAKIQTRGTSAEVRVAMNEEIFKSTCGYFLADLITKCVAEDLLRRSDVASSAIASASEAVANGWYDRFEEKFIRSGKAEHKDMLQTIADNYSFFAR